MFLHLLCLVQGGQYILYVRKLVITLLPLYLASQLSHVCIGLCAKRCSSRGLCISVENKRMLEIVFLWNCVLNMCMDEWLFSTHNFSKQTSCGFNIYCNKQKNNNTGVAGGGSSFFPSFELCAVLHRDLPRGNEMLNKMYLKTTKNRKDVPLYFYNLLWWCCF